MWIPEKKSQISEQNCVLLGKHGFYLVNREVQSPKLVPEWVSGPRMMRVVVYYQTQTPSLGQNWLIHKPFYTFQAKHACVLFSRDSVDASYHGYLSSSSILTPTMLAAGLTTLEQSVGMEKARNHAFPQT
jgi:hypothetical protein